MRSVQIQHSAPGHLRFPAEKPVNVKESGAGVGCAVHQRDAACSGTDVSSIVFEFRQDAELESALRQLM